MFDPQNLVILDLLNPPRPMILGEIYYIKNGFSDTGIVGVTHREPILYKRHFLITIKLCSEFQVRDDILANHFMQTIFSVGAGISIVYLGQGDQLSVRAGRPAVS